MVPFWPLLLKVKHMCLTCHISFSETSQITQPHIQHAVSSGKSIIYSVYLCLIPSAAVTLSIEYLDPWTSRKV